jgi:GNAT superfamily N-acetyltransferase
MTIRTATADDRDQMLGLMRAMHAESVYSWLRFDDAKALSVIDNCLNREDHMAVVAVEGDTVVGLIGGYITAYVFSNDIIAFDLAPYVRADKRGGLTGVMLIKTFIQWAASKGAKEVVCGVTALPPEQREPICKLYERLGFYEAGRIFKRRL